MVSRKQMAGLVALSIGVVLMIYALRMPEMAAGALCIGIILALGGGIFSLVMNR